MNRDQIMRRVNQRLDGRLYRWEDIKYDFDDAILLINEKLQANFPMFTDVMIDHTSKYLYYTITDKEKGVVYFETEELWDQAKLSPHYTNITGTSTMPVFPDKYIRTVVIPSVVARLLEREDEFGNLQSSIRQEASNGLNTMFLEYYDLVPGYFINDGGTMDYTNNHSRGNPFEINRAKEYKGPLDE